MQPYTEGTVMELPEENAPGKIRVNCVGTTDQGFQQHVKPGTTVLFRKEDILSGTSLKVGDTVDGKLCYRQGKYAHPRYHFINNVTKTSI